MELYIPDLVGRLLKYVIIWVFLAHAADDIRLLRASGDEFGMISTPKSFSLAQGVCAFSFGTFVFILSSSCQHSSLALFFIPWSRTVATVLLTILCILPTFPCIYPLRYLQKFRNSI